MLSIIRYELEKIMRNKTFLVLFIASLLVLMGIFQIGFNYSQLSSINDSNREKGYSEFYKQIANKHKGDFNDEKVEEILADFIDRYQDEGDIDKRPFDLFSYDIGSVFFSKDEDIYLKMNDAIEHNEKITIDQINLKSIDEIGFKTFDKLFTIGSYSNWSDLYVVLGMTFILLCIIVIVICSTIYSNEVSSGINQLLLSTKYGRSKLISSKIISSILVTISGFIFIQLITLIAFYLRYYGFDGWDTSIQVNFSIQLFNFPIYLNHLQIYFIIIIFQLFALLSIAGTTLLISSFSKSNLASVLISIGIFLLPAGLIQIFREGIIHDLLYLFPINLYNPTDMLSVLSTDNGFLFNSFIANFSLVIGIFVIVTFLLNIIGYNKVKKSFN